MAALYRHLNVTGDLDLINLDQFNYIRKSKKVTTISKFYNDDRWVTLTTQTDEILAPKALRDRFGGLSAMKNFIGIDETPPALEQSFNVPTELNRELQTDLDLKTVPLMGLLFLAKIFLLKHERHHL